MPFRFVKSGLLTTALLFAAAALPHSQLKSASTEPASSLEPASNFSATSNGSSSGL